jgi:hypothetical protein
MKTHANVGVARMLKGLVTGAVFSLLVGCNAGQQLLEETAQEINVKAFNGEISSAVKFCSRDEARRVHSLYDMEKDEIRIAGDWLWEPSYYFQGVVAYEMIRAWQRRYREDGKPVHDSMFYAMRAQVAKDLDIPIWAIPDGSRPDKLDATREMAHLDKWLNSTRARFESSPGWPTRN